MQLQRKERKNSKLVEWKICRHIRQLGWSKVSDFNTRALNLTLLTLSTLQPQQRNKGKKYTSSKISMNVHFDFGFSFYAMRCCCDKTLRKNGRHGTPHPKPADGLLLLRRWNQDQGIEFNGFFLWIEQQMIDFGLLSTIGTTLDCFQPSGTILVHIGLIITILGHFLTWF